MNIVVLSALRTVFSVVVRGALRGSITVLVCLVAQELLKKLHAPHMVRRLLWLFAATRFFCSFSLPILPSVSLDAAQTTAQTVYVQTIVSSEVALAATVEPAEQIVRLSAGDVLAAVWVVGAVILAVHAAWSTLQLRHSVCTAWRCTEDSHIYYTGACVGTPFVLGFVRPRIYLPANLNEVERRCVLLHENAHLKHGDPLLRPAYYLLACVYWFCPFAWVAFRRFNQESEALCDEAVLRAPNAVRKVEYCSMLLRFATPARGCSAAFSEGSLTMRIQSILYYKKVTLTAAVGGVILAAAVGVLCLASPAAEANSPSEVPVQLPESTVGAEITEPTPEPVLVADNSATNDIATPTPTQTAVLITAEATASDANLISVSLLWCVPDYTSVSVYTSDTHHGIDIAAAKGADILAAADGTVTFAGWSGTYGYYVEIDHGNGLITRYKHCSKVNVKEGESVLQGQKIAAVGSTGRSTGNHCHFEAYQDDICLTINEPSK